MQVDSVGDFGGSGGADGGEGATQHQQQPQYLQVDGEVLEWGLKCLVPSLCAYLRGHTEVSEEGGGGIGGLRLRVVWSSVGRVRHSIRSWRGGSGGVVSCEDRVGCALVLRLCENITR